MPSDKDQEREDRIHNEAIVDAYGSEERAMSWYYHLDDQLMMPFKARCITERSMSPLKVGKIVEVSAMADMDDCEKEIFVLVQFAKRELAVPLIQLQPIDADESTTEAIEDWHYWVGQGYQF